VSEPSGQNSQMEEMDWEQDAAQLRANEVTLQNLEANTSLGKTLTYEASDAVDNLTRKLLERSWQDCGEAGDRNRELLEQLLERAHTLRRKVSKFVGPRYEHEYRAWVQSWRGC
jgi:hypothetical protein